MHSGDARRMSISPISFRKASRRRFSRRLANTLASGKLTANVLVAVRHMSTPATISTPAACAPVLLPPAPQNMSNPLIVIALSVCFHRTLDTVGFRRNGRRMCPTRRRLTFSSSRVSHSHIIRTRQPRFRNASWLRLSRATLPVNFFVQNGTRDFGMYAYRHPR